LLPDGGVAVHACPMFIGTAILIYVGGWCFRYVISGKKNIAGR